MFDIYDSTLLDSDGVYQSSQSFDSQEFALKIDYLRSISSEDFTDATVEQWMKLEVDKDFIESWQAKLLGIFPSVEKGDSLVYVNKPTSELWFSQKENSEWVCLYTFDDQFSHNFLSIWLSENTQYPKLKRQMIGDVK
jgi:hypothetical protein